MELSSGSRLSSRTGPDRPRSEVAVIEFSTSTVYRHQPIPVKKWARSSNFETFLAGQERFHDRKVSTFAARNPPVNAKRKPRKQPDIVGIVPQHHQCSRYKTLAREIGKHRLARR